MRRSLELVSLYHGLVQTSLVQFIYIFLWLPRWYTTSCGCDVNKPLVTPNPQAIEILENDLAHLRGEWTAIHIVLHSLVNAYTIWPLEAASRQVLEDMDRELAIACDELKTQIRHLHKCLERLDGKVRAMRNPSCLSCHPVP
ncbi:uncharacterized protein BYT42DRAFT_614148 [Radiomyces spectabilis]|uniref:uncharacterized protein n=1 Tax=Radiomyces spectabilis TaxID=64574 RepID=UPI002220CDDD|nr:uncharacterized protein BYT42DRAFT_614148 [Radiomyces spectabilis]KAI8377464.1 hypothetical protein BYT42DRAFT_614148 [Radiomyces spectabilis]